MRQLTGGRHALSASRVGVFMAPGRHTHAKIVEKLGGKASPDLPLSKVVSLLGGHEACSHELSLRDLIRPGARERAALTQDTGDWVPQWTGVIVARRGTLDRLSREPGIDVGHRGGIVSRNRLDENVLPENGGQPFDSGRDLVAHLAKIERSRDNARGKGETAGMRRSVDPLAHVRALHQAVVGEQGPSDNGLSGVPRSLLQAALMRELGALVARRDANPGIPASRETTKFLAELAAHGNQFLLNEHFILGRQSPEARLTSAALGTIVVPGPSIAHRVHEGVAVPALPAPFRNDGAFAGRQTVNTTEALLDEKGRPIVVMPRAELAARLDPGLDHAIRAMGQRREIDLVAGIEVVHAKGRNLKDHLATQPGWLTPTRARRVVEDLILRALILHRLGKVQQDWSLHDYVYDEQAFERHDTGFALQQNDFGNIRTIGEQERVGEQHVLARIRNICDSTAATSPSGHAIAEADAALASRTLSEALGETLANPGTMSRLGEEAEAHIRQTTP